MRPWKSAEEVQEILGELGMRQAIYAHLKGTEWTTFSVGMESNTLQFTPSTWHGKLVSLLSLAVGQDIYDSNSLLIWGKWMNPGDGYRWLCKRPKTETA